jgi:nitrous oxide reductase
MIKYARFQIPAVAAGAQLGETNVNTPDDQVNRKVTGILSTNQTRLIRTVLMKQGTPIADIDNGLMAQQRDFIAADAQYGGGLPITVDVRNSNAGALAVNTDAIVIRYEA